MTNTLLMQTIAARPWAILPETFRLLVEYARNGIKNPEIEAAAKRQTRRAQSGSVAVIPLYGVISQRSDFMSMFFGGTSCEDFSAAIRQAAADPQVSAIVIDCDSPGGDVCGVQETADEVAKAAKVKPVIAVANSLMDSAAYWICSQATEIVASPSAMIGSIGVLAISEDDSKMIEGIGVKITIVSAGKYKTEGNPYEPLTPEAQGHMQAMVDTMYGQFVASVAKGRGVRASQVQSGYGEGRVLLAKDAVSANLADKQGTLRDVLARFGASIDAPRQQMRAEGEILEGMVEANRGRDVVVDRGAAWAPPFANDSNPQAVVTPPVDEEAIQHPAGCACEGCDAIREMIEEDAETPEQEQQEGAMASRAARARRLRLVEVA